MGRPRVGDRVRDVGPQTPAVALGDGVELRGRLLAPGPLGGPVRGVDEGERAARLAGLGHRVVTQVGGQEDVHTGGTDLLEEAVAGAAADGDAADRHVRVAGDADALGGRRQPGRGPGRELAQGLGMVQFADPAEAAAAFRIGRVGHQRAGDPQVEGAGEGVGDTRVGGVGVGVRDVQRDVVLDQRVHDAALEGAGLDGGGAPQVEGVVGDDQIGAQLHRLVGDLLNGVHGEQDPGDLGVRVAADGSDGIPLLGPRGGQRASSAAMTSERRGTGQGYRPGRPSRSGQPCRTGPPPHGPDIPERFAPPTRPGPSRALPPPRSRTGRGPPPRCRRAQTPRPPRANRRPDTRMCEAVLVVLFAVMPEN